MNRTPHGHGFYSRSGHQRGLTADQVANMTAYESHQSGFQRWKEGYGPNDSLLSGEYHSLTDDDLKRIIQVMKIYLPLCLVLYDTTVYEARIAIGTMMEQVPVTLEGLTAMLQEQQHILHQVLDTQKKMQKNQEEFEMKLSELAQWSKRSSSSSSPDNGRKKCRITRELTVSTPYNGKLWRRF